jgi:uncharacterized protein (TIGR00251 family)
MSLLKVGHCRAGYHAQPMAAMPHHRTRTGTSFYAWDGDVLILNILGKPAASKDAIGKPHGQQLKVSVTAAPQNGRATEHMLRFLAPLFGVKASDIEVVFGWEQVNKQLRIRAPQRLPEVIAALEATPCDNSPPGLTLRPSPTAKSS